MAQESRKAKQRRLLIDDIVHEARKQLASGGPSAVSLRGISRAVGMSAPSLYTYFASLNDLFTELIVQSYASLADAVHKAVDAALDEAIEQRLVAGPRAYREWALANRQQFNLVFFDQIAGYEAPVDGPTVDAQTAVLQPIAVVFAAARGVEVESVTEPGDGLDEFLAWWGAFHGMVALEVNHHLDWIDAHAVFERRLATDVAHILRS